jgi:hypothetical protein
MIAVESKKELQRRNQPSPDRLEACIYAAAQVGVDDWEGEVYHAGMAETSAGRERRRQFQLEENKVHRDEEDDDDIGEVFID